MAWVRIHDGALTHPKLVGLSDKAFRLWVWGLCYCQMHLTDGVIPAAAIPPPARTATVLTLAKLWDAKDDGGFTVHDYLDWNDSKAYVTKRRTEAKERIANSRLSSSREHARRVGIKKEDLEVLQEKEGAVSELGGSAERVLDAFRAHWKRLYGHECSLLTKPLEDMQLDQQITAHSEPRMMQALVAFFATDDQFVRNARHPLPMFLRDPLKYLAKPMPLAVRDRDEEARAEAAEVLAIVQAQERRAGR